MIECSYTEINDSLQEPTMSNLLTASEIEALANDTEALLRASGRADAAALVAEWRTNPSTSQGLVFRGMTAEALAEALARPKFTPMDDDDGAAQSDYVP